MKKLVLLALFSPLTLLAQSGKLCCDVTSTASFATMASDAAFRSSHLEPIPFMFAPEHGKDITFKTSDGTDGRGFEVKATNATNVYSDRESLFIDLHRGRDDETRSQPCIESDKGI